MQKWHFDKDVTEPGNEESKGKSHYCNHNTGCSPIQSPLQRVKQLVNRKQHTKVIKIYYSLTPERPFNDIASPRGFALASSATLNRLELGAQFSDHYCKIAPREGKVSEALLELECVVCLHRRQTPSPKDPPERALKQSNEPLLPRRPETNAYRLQECASVPLIILMLSLKEGESLSLLTSLTYWKNATHR